MQKIIDKIKKLHALSQSPNAYEADLAMDKLVEIAEKNELNLESLLDPDNRGVIEVKFFKVLDIISPYPSALDSAIGLLGTISGIFSGCQCISSAERDFMCIGYRTNLEIWEYTLQILVNQGRFDCKINRDNLFITESLKWNSYALGVAEKLRQIKGKDIFQKDAKSCTEAATELGFEVYINDNGTNFIDNEAFEAGKQALFSSGVRNSVQGLLE